MLSIEVEGKEIKGTIEIPSSKSLTHRYLIAAALSALNGKKTIINNPLLADDTIATIKALNELGVKFKEINEKRIVVDGYEKKEKAFIDCKASGTTARLITSLACFFVEEAVITGSEGLRKRPMEDLTLALRNAGLTINDALPLKIKGKIKDNKFKIKGNVSSQYISSLLFISPLLNATVEVIPPVVSRPYIDLTLQVMKEFGIDVKEISENTFKASGSYEGGNFNVEADYSSAAFIIAAGILGGEVKITNLKKDSLQGDKKIIDILKEMNASIEWQDNSLVVRKSKLKGTIIDAEHIPDLVPILCVIASQAEGKTIIKNVERLRIKESNRLVIVDLLKKLNAKIETDGKEIVIEKSNLKGNSFNEIPDDHRLVMALAIASLVSDGPIVLNNPLAINKSYPSFWEHLRLLNFDLTPWLPCKDTGSFKLSIFGTSHGRKIGALLEGKIVDELEINEEKIKEALALRRGNKLTTARKESDEFIIEKQEGKLKITIFNKDVKSEHYKEIIEGKVRPGHADYTAAIKYGINDYVDSLQVISRGSFHDPRGGGFFSARLTASVVALAALLEEWLKKKGITVNASIEEINGITQAPLWEKFIESIKGKDSVGGTIKLEARGFPAGIGNNFPWPLEAIISDWLWLVPGVKAIGFGSAWKASKMLGSQHNDEFILEEGKIKTLSNNHGGIIGGISSGMPITVRLVFKPTSSIAKEQRTVNISKMENTTISVTGRHDPCIALRGLWVAKAYFIFALTDILFREF